MRNTIVIMLAVLALAGCGGKAPAATNPQSTPTASVHKTAADIAKAMSLGTVTVWTATTDPNRLPGRPGGYISVATIVDKRLSCTDPATDCGATIEVYPTPDGAQARAQYIQGILGGGGILGTEYHTVIGPALLRVTGELTPDQAKVYADKFEVAAR